MTDGAIAGFKYFNIEKVEEVSVTVRGNGFGNIKITNLLNGEAIVNIPIKSQSKWRSFVTPVKLPEGKQALFFTYEGMGAIDFLKFELK